MDHLKEMERLIEAALKAWRNLYWSDGSPHPSAEMKHVRLKLEEALMWVRNETVSMPQEREG